MYLSWNWWMGNVAVLIHKERKATGQQIICPLIAKHAKSEKLLYACAYMYKKCIT